MELKRVRATVSGIILFVELLVFEKGLQNSFFINFNLVRIDFRELK